MYKISVPVMNYHPYRAMDRENTLSELRRLGADRVFLCVGRGIEPEDERNAELRALGQNIRFFEAAGLEVGVWMSSLGHGVALVQDQVSGEQE